MRDEQVQQLLCLLNHYACLSLLFTAYLQIDRNFSQGEKTSTLAALPVLHSHPHQCQAPLITQLSNIQPTSSKCSSATLPHFLSSLSSQQRPNGALCLYDSTWKLRINTGSPPKPFCCILHPQPWNIQSNDLLLADILYAAFQEFHPLKGLSLTKSFIVSFPSVSITDFMDTRRQWGELNLEKRCVSMVTCDMPNCFVQHLLAEAE